MLADEARERERTALLEGYLQGACGIWETCWILAAGRKVDYGDKAVEKQLREYAQRGFGDVGRVRTGAGAHRALPFATLAVGIAKSSCFGKSTAATLSLRLT